MSSLVTDFTTNLFSDMSQFSGALLPSSLSSSSMSVHNQWCSFAYAKTLFEIWVGLICGALFGIYIYMTKVALDTEVS